DYSGTGFIFATFEKEKETILFPREHCEIVEAILHYDQQHNPTDGVMANSETPSGRNKHIDLVKKGIVAIERGYFRKVVLSRKELMQSSNLDAIRLFRRL